MKQKLAHILFLGGALVLPSVALAVGLGEPRQEPVLGQRLDLSIPLLGGDELSLMPAAFGWLSPVPAKIFPG